MVLIGLGAVASTGQSAAPPARQSATFLFSTKDPGRSAGVSFGVDWRDPANPNGKPYSVARVTIELPPGATIDTGALTRCTASDAQIQAQGSSACPAASRLGGGTIVSDTGSSAGFPRFVENRVVNFNGDREQIGVADSVNFPPVPGFGRVVTRTSIRGRTSTFDVPGFPGNPPPDNFTAFRSLRLTGKPAGTAARPYVRTPPTCPSPGRWITVLTFLYRDGASQTVRAPSPCRRTAGSTCLSRRSPVGRGGIGRVRLGASRRRLQAVPAGRPLRRGRIVRYCVKGSRGRVLAALDRRGRSEVVVSTAGGHGNRGVRPGRPSASLRRAYRLRFGLASGVFRAGPGRRQLIGVRRGRIRFVGVATDRLLRHPRSLRRAIDRLDRQWRRASTTAS